MDYIAVKEAAEKFQLSERRVQKLCETNRIDGCKMVSGICVPGNTLRNWEKQLPAKKDST